MVTVSPISKIISKILIAMTILRFVGIFLYRVSVSYTGSLLRRIDGKLSP